MSSDDDVLLALAPTERGDGVHVLRKRAESIELGEVRPAKDGQPIHGELVRLKAREESPRVFDVEVLADTRSREARSGPAQVATTAYRKNWDAIFAAAPDDELN